MRLTQITPFVPFDLLWRGCVVRTLCLSLAFSVISGAALAQTVELPSDAVSSKQRAEFRLCRAAILVEDGAGEGARTRLSRATVSAMREQITFIMSETIFNLPAYNIEDGRKRAEFTEKFVIDFSRTLNKERERLGDIKERERLLLDCQPVIWLIMKENIDELMRWRLKAMGLEKPTPSAAKKAVTVTE